MTPEKDRCTRAYDLMLKEGYQPLVLIPYGITNFLMTEFSKQENKRLIEKDNEWQSIIRDYEAEKEKHIDHIASLSQQISEKDKIIEDLKAEVDLKQQFFSLTKKTHPKFTEKQINELWLCFRQDKQMADLQLQLSEAQKLPVKIDKFIVAKTMGEDIEQISVPLDTYEEAEEFKNRYPTRYPNSYILATLKPVKL